MSPELYKYQVPYYHVIEKRVKEIDEAIMVFRAFFIPVESVYRFQLIKKDKMCNVELHKPLIDSLKNGDARSEEELAELLLLSIENESFWTDIQ
ncbi:MAG: hypothetical protein HY809_09360 [Nitrospirae bacterium]|nr:hypothetical protein [Nitrospirota bacterium]